MYSVLKTCFLLFACLIIGLPPASIAGKPEPTWLGLIGLYTQPTAETISQDDYAVKFSEIRFSQRNGQTRLRDTWFAGSITVAPISRLEVAATLQHEIVKTGPLGMSGFTEEYDKATVLGHIKYILLRPGPRNVGLAIGVMDITDETKNVEALATERGRRLFLVGTYKWVHLGLTNDGRGMGAYAGARWSMSNHTDLLAELVSEPLFVGASPDPSNHMNFNLGLRVHPREVPNLHIDITAVGDGEFNFGFALGYIL